MLNLLNYINGPWDQAKNYLREDFDHLQAAFNLLIGVSAGTVHLNQSNYTYANSNGVSFGLNTAGVITATVKTDYMPGTASTITNVLFSAGTLSSARSDITFGNSNGLAFGLNTNGVITGSYTVPSTVGLLSAIKFSGGTLSSNRSDITFGDSNGVSFGLNTNGVVTATVKTDYQSSGAYLTTARASNDAIGLNTALTGNGVSWTVNSSGLSLNIPAFLTTAALSQDSSKYAGTNAAITGGSITVNTSGVSINLPAYLTTAMDSNRGSDFVQASATFYGTNASGTIASNGISVSVAPQSVESFKISAGTLSQNRTDFTLADSNGVSWGLNTNGVVTATVKTDYQSSGAYLTTAMQSNAATISNVNVSAGTISRNLSALTFGDSNGISWGLNTNSVITATVKTDYQSSGAYLTTGMQSNAATISNVKISAGTKSALRSDITFGDSNGVSWGLDTNGSITATVKTDYQSSGAYLTTAALSGDTTKYVQNWKLTGNTAGTTSSAQGTDLWFSGGNSITVSGNSNTIVFSVGNYLTTAMASGRGSDFIQATAVFHGTNASGTIASDGISVSVAAPGAGGSINVSAGTTSNNLSALTFADGNGISFGLDGSTLTATVATNYQSAGAYLTTAALSSQTLAITLGGNIATTNSSRILDGGYILAGGNNITIQQSNNTLSISGPSLAAYLTTAMASNRGSDFVQATAGFHGTNASGTIASDGISVSVAPAAGQSNQTVGLYASSNTYLTSSGTVDARSMSFRGDKSITVGISSGEVVFSVGAYLTTAALSGDSSKYAGINGAITGGSITVNTSGVSVNLPAYLTTAALSGDTSKYIQAWELEGANTAGTTSSAQGTKLYLSAGNSLTFSGNSNTIVLSIGPYLTTAALSQDSSKYAGINGAITGGSITVNTSGVSINLPAYLTTADLSANSSNYFRNWKLTGNTAGTTSSAQGTDFWLAGGNGVTVSGSSNTISISVATNYQSQGAYLTTAALSGDTTKYVQNWKITGNTAGTTSSAQGTDLWLAGGNGVTLSGNSNSITVSVATSYLASNASTNYAGVGETVGTIAGTDLAMTVNTAGVSIGYPKWITTARASSDAIGLNTAQSNVTWTANSSGLSLDARGYAGTATAITGAVSMTVNSGGVSLSQPVVSEFDPLYGNSLVLENLVNSQIIFMPFDVPHNVSASRINFYVSLTHTYSGAPNNSTAWMAMGYGLYTRMTGTGTDRISLLTSYSLSLLSGSVSSSTRLSMTHYIGLSNATSHSTSGYAQNNATAPNYLANSVAGFRVVPLPMNLTLTPGRYWLGYSNNTSSQGASFILGMSVQKVQFVSQTVFQPFGTSSSASNASVFGTRVGLGRYSALTAAWPATIPLTTQDITMAAGPTIPYFNFSGIGTSTNIP